MSAQRLATGINPLATTAIPVLQTVSLRLILEFFGKAHTNTDIVALEAEGGTTDGRTEVLNELYGVNFVLAKGDVIKINYKQKRNLRGEPQNPLDEYGTKKILDYIDEKLEAVEVLGGMQPPDISVSKFTIEIIDDILAEIAAEVTPWFDGNRNRFLITGFNDPAEDRKGSQAKRPIDEVFSLNRGLMIGQGFKGRVINFRSVIETARVHGTEKELYLAQWDGAEDHYPEFPTVIGEYIYQNILPDTYSELNYYYPDAKLELQLDGWISR